MIERAYMSLTRKRLRALVKRCVIDGIVWQDASYFMAKELIRNAYALAPAADVPAERFLALCGVPEAMAALRIDSTR